MKISEMLKDKIDEVKNDVNLDTMLKQLNYSDKGNKLSKEELKACRNLAKKFVMAGVEDKKMVCSCVRLVMYKEKSGMDTDKSYEYVLKVYEMSKDYTRDEVMTKSSQVKEKIMQDFKASLIQDVYKSEEFKSEIRKINADYDATLDCKTDEETRQMHEVRSNNVRAVAKKYIDKALEENKGKMESRAIDLMTSLTIIFGIDLEWNNSFK